MRYALLIGLVVLAVAAVPQLCRAGSFDGVGATVEPGKVALSVGYWYEADRWKADDITLTATGGGTTVSGTFPLGDFNTASNQGYAQIAVGLFPGWEAYLRLGGADFRSTDLSPNFSDSTKFFGSIGFNGSFYKDKMYAVGPFAQFSLYGQYKDSFTENVAGIGNITTNVTVKNYYGVRAGIAGAVTVQDVATFYGGPFFTYNHATLDLDAAATVSGIPVSVSGSTSLRTRDYVGAFVGVKVPITKALGIGAEAQVTGGWGAGAKITYSF